MNGRPKPALWILACLSGWLVSEATCQTWHSTETIPVFRGIASMDYALRKFMDSSACRSNLGALWVSAQNYALDHADRLPQDWSNITNQIAEPGVLYCPADALHLVRTNWGQVDWAAISYEILAPGAGLAGPSQTFIRCKVHGNTVTTHGERVTARPFESRSFPLVSSNSIWLPVPALLAAREASASLDCQNRLRQLGYAAQLFATDHNDFMPSSLGEMADALDSLQSLVCPSDLLRSAAANLTQLNPSSITYRIDAPGVSGEVTPSQRYITCPIHDHHFDTDGSVAVGTNRYPPRLIIGHPLSWTVEPGHPLELAVVMGDPGLGPFRYQWRRQQPFDAVGDPFTNTVIIPDATNRTYRITAVTAADEGYYDVIVNDSHGGYQISHLAYVRVVPLTNVNSVFTWDVLACANNLKCIGLAARLFATANHGQSPHNASDLTAYLGWPLSLYCPSDTNWTAPNTWETVDFANLSYTLEPDVPANPGTDLLATCKVHHYYVQADTTVKFGETPPAIFLHPTSQATFAGRTASLHVGAIGDSMNYQWIKNGQSIAGETNSILTLTNLDATDAAGYAAVVSNGWGSATSHVAVLTMDSIPRPHLEIALTNSGTELILSLTGPIGTECVFEASPDLSSWTTLCTNVLTEGTARFAERLVTLPTARFYRAVLR